MLSFELFVLKVFIDCWMLSIFSIDIFWHQILNNFWGPQGGRESMQFDPLVMAGCTVGTLNNFRCDLTGDVLLIHHSCYISTTLIQIWGSTVIIFWCSQRPLLARSCFARAISCQVPLSLFCCQWWFYVSFISFCFFVRFYWILTMHVAVHIIPLIFYQYGRQIIIVCLNELNWIKTIHSVSGREHNTEVVIDIPM